MNLHAEALGYVLVANYLVSVNDEFKKESKFYKKRWESSQEGTCPSGYNY